MKTTRIADRDFAEWVDLAEKDQTTFESLRQAAIDDFIESVPQENQDRLRRLQWRIDQERRLARTPMNACVRLSRMMWQNVVGEGGLRDRFEQLGVALQGQSSRESAAQEPSPPARVLRFARD